MQSRSGEMVNIAQTAPVSSLQNATMPNTALYWWRADKWARLAKDATDPRKRAYYEALERTWIKIAEQLEVNERYRVSQITTQALRIRANTRTSRVARFATSSTAKSGTSC